MMGFTLGRLSRTALPGFILLISFPALAFAQTRDSCALFHETIRTTYNFRPALLSESDRDKKSAAMDKVWETVKADSAVLLPCLRKELEDPQSDSWFRFDGSALLVSLDPSPAAKALQVRNYTSVNLDDVDLRVWVSTLAERGAEGFDVSEAGARWLVYPKATYYLPEHGAAKVDSFVGAFFIYGSMDETQATPALLKIASDAGHPAREQALAILLFQATPEALKAVSVSNRIGRSAKAQEAMRKLLENPSRVKPREQPKSTREEYLKAFDAFVNGNGAPFAALVAEVPDGERDVVTVLKSEDVPLVRKVRRKMIARATPHAFEYYKTFTEILMTLVWRPELVK